MTRKYRSGGVIIEDKVDVSTEEEDDNVSSAAFSSSINSRRHCSAISAASNFSSPVNEHTTTIDDDDASSIVTFVDFFDGGTTNLDLDSSTDTTDNSLDQDEISRANSCRWSGVMVPNEREPSRRIFRDR